MRNNIDNILINTEDINFCLETVERCKKEIKEISNILPSIIERKVYDLQINQFLELVELQLEDIINDFRDVEYKINHDLTIKIVHQNYQNLKQKLIEKKYLYQ